MSESDGGFFVSDSFVADIIAYTHKGHGRNRREALAHYIPDSERPRLERWVARWEKKKRRAARRRRLRRRGIR